MGAAPYGSHTPLTGASSTDADVPVGTGAVEEFVPVLAVGLGVSVAFFGNSLFRVSRTDPSSGGRMLRLTSSTIVPFPRVRELKVNSAGLPRGRLGKSGEGRRGPLMTRLAKSSEMRVIVGIDGSKMSKYLTVRGAPVKPRVQKISNICTASEAKCLKGKQNIGLRASKTKVRGLLSRAILFD